MKRSWRIILEVLGPPGLGAVVFIVQMFVIYHGRLEWGDFLRMIFFWSYLLATIPSVVYALILEGSIRSGLSARSWKFVALSTMLGVGAGFFIGMSTPALAFLLAINGAFTGLLIGLLIRTLTAATERGAG